MRRIAPLASPLAAMCVGVTVASTVTTNVALAQTREENWKKCTSVTEPDAMITGCTAVIQSGRETSEELSFALANRGGAWDKKGQHERGIQDFDQAIRLYPQNFFAFYGRGVAYLHKNQTDRAIQDLDRAIGRLE